MGLKVKEVRTIGKTGSKNPKDLYKDMQNLPKIILERFKKDFDTEMEFFVERSQQNAPILDGKLRKSIKHETKIEKTMIRGEISSNLPYSLRRHESEYNLGPVSQMQPVTPEGGVGNKFIERALNFNAPGVGERLGKSQQRILKDLEREAR